MKSDPFFKSNSFVTQLIYLNIFEDAHRKIWTTEFKNVQHKSKGKTHFFVIHFLRQSVEKNH